MNTISFDEQYLHYLFILRYCFNGKNLYNIILENDLVKDKVDCNTCSIKYFYGGGCRAEENNSLICKYNCKYFKFAVDYFGRKTFEK